MEELRSRGGGGAYHRVVPQTVHEESRLGALVEVEPDAPLELVPGVQQENVLLAVPDFVHLPGPPRYPGEAWSLGGGALPRFAARRLHPGVDVVGVQQD